MGNIRVLRLPRVYQRGNGLGGLILRKVGSFLRPLFSSFLHAAKPIAKETLKKLGKEGIKEGAQLLTDIAEGQNVKEAVKNSAKRGLKKGKDVVIDEIANTIKRAQKGGRKGKRKPPLQTGQGKKRKKNQKKRISRKKNNKNLIFS